MITIFSFFSLFFTQIMSVVIKTSLFNLIGLFVAEAMYQFFFLNYIFLKLLPRMKYGKNLLKMELNFYVRIIYFIKKYGFVMMCLYRVPVYAMHVH